MKKKISKILGVVLTLALLSSMVLVAAPVSAAIGTNAFGTAGMPAVAEETDVGPMAIDPDTGDIYAGVFDADDMQWDVKKSTDDGVTWTNTKLVELDVFDMYAIVDIVISEDGTIYVGCLNGDVYRLAGTSTPVLLKAIVDSSGDTLEEIGIDYWEYTFGQGLLYDMEVWYDGNSSWILVACSLDVLVLRDALFEDWRDQELTSSYNDSGDLGDFTEAFEVAYAPDFDTSSIIWAIIGVEADGYGWGGSDEVLMITSTISPGQWGWLIDEVIPENQDGDAIDAGPYVDLAFPDTYTSASPVLYAALSGGTPEQGGDDGEPGNLFLIQAEWNPGDSEAMPLLDTGNDSGDIDIVSVEVSGEVILAGALNSPTIFRSDNGGATFDVIGWDPDSGDPVGKGPTGWGDNWSWIGTGYYDYSWTHVYMAPGDFDATDGVAYVATIGAESAVSLSTDGGVTYNQIGLIDTTIDRIKDLAFSPEGASQPAFMRTSGESEDGDGNDYYSRSLWRTDDATASKPVWERVLNFAVSNGWDAGNFEEAFRSVEYALDGSAIMLSLDNEDQVWKSTDNGQTFSHWRTLPGDIDRINDWVVVDSATIYCATDDGFYGTSPSAPSNHELTSYDLESIAVFGDTIAVGTDNGQVAVSIDAGETWGTPVTIASDDIFVAFGPTGILYAASSDSEVQQVSVTGNKVSASKTKAVEDSFDDIAEADSFSGIWVSPDNTLYAMGGDSVAPTSAVTGLFLQGNLQLDEVEAGTDPRITLSFGTGTSFPLTDPDWDAADTPTVEGLDLVASGFDSVVGSIFVTNGSDAADTILIDMSGTLANLANPLDPGDGWFYVTDETGLDVALETVVPASSGSSANDLWRLLIGESGNIWETENRDDARGLWGSTGSNFLWTVVDQDGLYACKDTLSGQVAGVTVSAVSETSAKVSWTAMTGAKQYEVKYDSTTVLVPGTPSSTPATTKTLTGLSDDKTYSVKVRVKDDQAFQSRWSSAVTFTTVQAILAPTNLVPVNGMQDAPLLPSFGWTEVSNAVSYEFELGADPDFSDATAVTGITVIFYTWETELNYDQNYYWRVRAVSDTGTKSDWCTFNFHTRVEAIPPVTVPPPPTPTITVVIPDVVVPEITIPPLTQPDVIVNLPTPSVTTTTFQPADIVMEEVAPAYIWAIVGIGAVLVIAVIVLIVRTRRIV